MKRNARLETDGELAVKQMLEGHARKVAELFKGQWESGVLKGEGKVIVGRILNNS